MHLKIVHKRKREIKVDNGNVNNIPENQHSYKRKREILPSNLNHHNNKYNQNNDSQKPSRNFQANQYSYCQNLKTVSSHFFNSNPEQSHAQNSHHQQYNVGDEDVIMEINDVDDRSKFKSSEADVEVEDYMYNIYFV